MIITQSIMPTYVIMTFFIRNPNPPREQLVTCEELAQDKRSLELSEWQVVLEEYGWCLIRPPCTHVFYANDILYVDAEIPARMITTDGVIITNYFRAIASLVFPHVNISVLPVNMLMQLTDSSWYKQRNL